MRCPAFHCMRFHITFTLAFTEKGSTVTVDRLLIETESTNLIEPNDAKFT